MPITSAGPRQSVEEIGVSSTVSPVRKSTDVPHDASPSVQFPSETVPGPSAAQTSPPVTAGRVNWQIGGQPAPDPDHAVQGQTTSSGLVTGSPRSVIAVEAAADTLELVTRSPDPTSAAPQMPRLSEVAKQQETMMDQVTAENSRLKIELRDLRTAYNKVAGELDQFRDDCRIVSKEVLNLFAPWARQ